MQPEILWIYQLQWHPHQVGGIVIGLGLHIVCDVYLIKHVDGVDDHLGIEILVGDGKEIADIRDPETCLLQYLTTHAVLHGLLHVDKATGKVQRALGRLLAATSHQQFTFVIADKGRRGRAGVGIIGEATSRALLALEVVLMKSVAATKGAILEFV